MPISPSKDINLFVNVPLKKINHRLEQHKVNPFAISASENAVIEESDAKDRDIKKKQRVEEFHSQTKLNVLKREEDLKKQRDEQNHETV